MTRHSDFPKLVEAFFTERLLRQRKASPETIAGYRDAFRLLLRFAARRLKKEPSKLALKAAIPGEAIWIGISAVAPAMGKTGRGTWVTFTGEARSDGQSDMSFEALSGESRPNLSAARVRAAQMDREITTFRQSKGLSGAADKRWRKPHGPPRMFTKHTGER